MKRKELIEKRIAAAEAAMEAGFLSEAARKKALGYLNSAYDAIKTEHHDMVCEAAWKQFPGTNQEDYANRGEKFFGPYSLPLSFAHFKVEKHGDMVIKFLGKQGAAFLADMMIFRVLIKDAPIAKVEKPAIAKLTERIRKNLIEEMERRQELFVERLDVSKMLAKNGHAPTVYARAHWVIGHKGTRFLRTFFYLNGEVASLGSIIAIFEQLERDGLIEMEK